DVFLVDPVVADHRIGHGHDLSAIRRIGEDLLVAGHGRVEDDLAGRFADGAERAAAEDPPVTEHEEGVGHDSHTTFPATIVFHGRPVAVHPANGVLRLLDLNVAGSILTTASGSINVRSAGAPTRTPRALASRTSRTAPAVERCATCTCAPVSSASTMSRATMTSSAAAGIPGSPSSVETTPSFMQPARASVWSSAWLITGAPKGRVYSIARR